MIASLPMDPTPLDWGLAVGTCDGACVVGGVGAREGDLVGEGDGAFDVSELSPEQV